MPDTSLPDTAPPRTEQSPKLTFDWTEWLPYVADADLSDDQKRELVETLWRIVVAFVDLGWELEPRAAETSGQTLDLRTALETAVLNSENTNHKQEGS